MKPGSLVAYIGGQTAYDIALDHGLDPNVIYEIKAIGTRFIRGKNLKCVELFEMPNVSHLIWKFRELQPPGRINFEEFVCQPRTV